MRPVPDPPIRLAAVSRPPCRPCPSQLVAVLGFDQPTLIPCGREKGHDGPHHRSFQWGNSAAESAPTGEARDG